MESPIKYSDLLQPDESIKNAIAQLEELRTKYNEMQKDISTQAKEISKSMQNVNVATEQGIKETETAAKETDKLAQAQKALEFAQSETAKELAKLRAQLASVNAETKLQTKLNQAAEGSYDQLSAQYSLNKKRLNAMSEEERKTAEQTEQLVSKTRELYERMKQLQEETGKHQLNVGNYTQASDAIKNYADKLREAIGLGGNFGDAALALGKGGGEMRSMFAELGGSVQAFGKTLLTLLSNPVFLTVAGFAAAGAAFKFWFDYNKGLVEATRLTSEFTGKTGNDLKNYRNEVLAIADVYGKEFNDVLTAADSLSSNFGISADNALKLIRDGFAAGVDDAGDMLGAIKDMPASFKELGVSAEEYLTIIQQTNSGIFSTDGMKAIEKAGNRLRVMTNETAQGLAAIGIDANKLHDELLSGDKSMLQAVQEISIAISKMPLESQNAAVAIKSIFDDEGLRLGREQIASFAELNLSFEDLQKNAGAYNEQQQQIIQSQIDLNNATTALFDSTGGKFEELTTSLTVLKNQVLTAILNTIIDIYNNIAELYNTSIGFRAVFNGWLMPLKLTFDTVKNALIGVWELVKGIGTVLKGIFTLDFSLVGEGLKSIALNQYESAKRTLGDWKETINDAVDSVQNGHIEPITIPAKVETEEPTTGKNVSRENSKTNETISTSSTKQDDLYKKQLEARRKYEDALIAVMEDGYDKQKKLIETQYNRQIEDAQHQAQTDLQNKQTYDLQVIAAENNKNKALEKLDAEWQIKFIEQQKQSLQTQLQIVKQGTQQEYELKLQSLEYDRQIALLKNSIATDKQSESDINIKFDLDAEKISDDFNNAKMKIFEQEQAFKQSEFDLLKTTENEKTIFRLNAERERLKKVLELNKTANEKMSDLEIKTIQNQIAKIDAEIAEKQDGGILQKIGVIIDDKGKESIKTSFDYAKSMLNDFMASKTAIANQDVENANNEVAAAQSVLDNEIRLAELGYANNVEDAKRNLDLAKEQQKQALEEQQRAQKQQARIATMEQAVNLVTATAKIWGQLGFPWAIPAIATMWASFAISKIKAKTETKESYGDGTIELLEGGSHASGNDIDLGTKKDGTKRRAEGGEFFAVINKRASKKYRQIIPSLINSINKENFDANMLEREKNNYMLNVTQSNVTDLSKLESKLSELTNIVKNRTEIHQDYNGNIVIRQGNHTRIINK